ncbi:hypothetical protein MKW94_022705 [Papaver nudicaule]|uniref:PsbP C-terminal domain-containing protein n=1 Tax=Papaver nudicaule TaxID=74823 RepID=A0AA41RYT9_PAPNU|nr:hypothetical protein [Papaver nudicaule]
MVTAAATTPISYKFSSSAASNSPSSSSRSHHHTPSLKLPAGGSTTNSSPTKLLSVSTRNESNDNANQDMGTERRRREFMAAIGLISINMNLWMNQESISEAKEIDVGSFLPPFPSDPSFVVFKASSKDTPALRAGNVAPYNFIIPPSWKQLRVANILSGNYCQPKCAEPWVEVKFENEKQGKIQVVASPLIRLTNKLTATIEEIGTPEKLIASLGPFVTGNTLDSEEIVETTVEKQGDQTYYKYVLDTPFALTGTHNLAKATAKGNTVILFVVSASDKQWQASQKTLKAILDSFEV